MSTNFETISGKSKRKVYEFARQKIVLNSGKETWRPVVRQKMHGLLKLLYSNSWDTITCVYGKYILMNLPFDPELTREECEAHIINYQNLLKESIATDIKTEETEEIEEKEY